VVFGVAIAGFLVDFQGGAKTIALAGLFVIPAVIAVYKIKEKRSRKPLKRKNQRK